NMTDLWKTSRRGLMKGGVALAAIVGLGERAARAQDRASTAHLKKLYAAAKAEGELTWYTAHSDDVTAQALGRDFEAAFPGLKANVVRTTAQVAYQRVTQELRANAMQVDVLSSTDMGT